MVFLVSGEVDLRFALALETFLWMDHLCPRQKSPTFVVEQFSCVSVAVQFRASDKSASASLNIYHPSTVRWGQRQEFSF